MDTIYTEQESDKLKNNYICTKYRFTYMCMIEKTRSN